MSLSTVHISCTRCEICLLLKSIVFCHKTFLEITQKLAWKCYSNPCCEQNVYTKLLSHSIATRSAIVIHRSYRAETCFWFPRSYILVITLQGLYVNSTSILLHKYICGIQIFKHFPQAFLSLQFPKGSGLQRALYYALDTLFPLVLSKHPALSKKKVIQSCSYFEMAKPCFLLSLQGASCHGVSGWFWICSFSCSVSFFDGNHITHRGRIPQLLVFSPWLLHTCKVSACTASSEAKYILI